MRGPLGVEARKINSGGGPGISLRYLRHRINFVRFSVSVRLTKTFRVCTTITSCRAWCGNHLKRSDLRYDKARAYKHNRVIGWNCAQKTAEEGRASPWLVGDRCGNDLVVVALCYRILETESSGKPWQSLPRLVNFLSTSSLTNQAMNLISHLLLRTRRSSLLSIETRLHPSQTTFFNRTALQARALTPRKVGR